MASIPKISLKPEIPEALKAEVAESKWGKILSITPVVMTVIATMLAGLASSEMTRAQYERSLAAQRQSKAGDQWNFFQGKKLRGMIQRSTLEMIANTAEVRLLELAALRAALVGTPAAALLETEAGQQAVRSLREGVLPKAFVAPGLAAAVHDALVALEESRSDDEVARLLGRVATGELDEALRVSLAHALAFDGLIKPVGQAIEQFEKQLVVAANAALRRDFTAARLTYAAQRYDAEARMNQTIAGLYELQVRKSNLAAERHHRRSSRFFYGMLAAQAGVIVATLAMAAQKRNLLWGIAAGAGAVAVSFAVYVLAYV